MDQEHENEQHEEDVTELPMVFGHEGTGMGSRSAAFVHLPPVVGPIGTGFPGKEATGMGSQYLPVTPVVFGDQHDEHLQGVEKKPHDEHLAAEVKEPAPAAKPKA